MTANMYLTFVSFAVARLPKKRMLILLRYQKMTTIEPNRKYSTPSEGWKKM
jgi:hypothetical protein